MDCLLHYAFKIVFLQCISTGALRLPDGPKKPLPLKPVDRKPLESVVQYLGKKKKLVICCIFNI